MKPIMPCLWSESEKDAREAAEFYVSLFPNSKITGITYNTEAGHERVDTDGNTLEPLPAGSLLTISMKLFGQDFMILNGGPLDKYNHSISLMALCETQAEIDDIWDKILKNGGTPEQCGWIRDKWGLCWQVAPANFGEMLGDKNQAKANAFMKEMMTQVKFDIAKLEKAYNNA